MGCGGGGAGASRECPAAITGSPERTPPAGLGVLPGAHVYVSEGPFGKTSRFYAVADGDDIVAVRDRAADALVAAGYELLRTDEEPPVEAEAHARGPQMVSVQVTTLCAGKLRLRYTVS